jgi:cytoplasmic iron level regulating protein YaaA (DUF328/UPF0246 family)
MKILLSPAKSLHSTCAIPVGEYSVPFFEKEARILAGKLKNMSAKKLVKLMHLSDELAELNFERYQKWYFSKEVSDVAFQAGFSFSGEVYRGLKLAEFSAEEMEQAQQSIRILSGLYGILRPLDVMYPYRLEMGTTWSITPKTKNLYTFWGSKLTAHLQKELAEEELVVNLASTEYAKAIQLKQLRNQVVTPVFKEFKNGDFKVIMMYAKNARGAMARYLIKQNASSVDEVKLFSEGGYSYDEKQSTPNELVFIR